MGCQCCQLHVHSSYSFLDGLCPVDDLVARAAELGQPGLGLTDHGVLYGAAPFFKACKKHGIKGLIGMEAYEAVPHTWDPEQHADIFKVKWADLNGRDRYYHLTMWAISNIGWENLCALHTISYTAAYKPKNQPLIDRATLERHSEGLVIGLGCMASRTNQAIARGGDGYEQAKWYVDVFEDRVYMEVMGVLDEQVALIRDQRKLAKKLGIEVIASNDVHYRNQVDGIENGPHHVLVQARRFKKKEGAEQSADKSDAGYGQWYGSDGFYLKSYEEMCATGGIMPDEVDRTLEVLDRSTFDFDSLPKPATPVAPVPAHGVDPDFDAFIATHT